MNGEEMGCIYDVLLINIDKPYKTYTTSRPLKCEHHFLKASVVGLECWLHRSSYGSIATPKKESNKWNSGRNLKKKANLR